MSSGPENRLIRAVHKMLPRTVHAEKMHNPYRGGTADCWYDGDLDVWVEYKWLASSPSRGVVKPKLSALQVEWLGARKRNGRRVFVAVGHPGGVVVFDTPEAWEQGIPAKTFTGLNMTRREFAEWLTEQVVERQDAENSGKAGSGGKKR